MKWELTLSGDSSGELQELIKTLSLVQPEAVEQVPYNPDGEAMDVLMYPAGADEAHHAAAEEKPKAKPRATKPKLEVVPEPEPEVIEPVEERITIDHALLRAMGADVMAAHGSPRLVALIQTVTGKRSIRELDNAAELQAVYDAFKGALA